MSLHTNTTPALYLHELPGALAGELDWVNCAPVALTGQTGRPLLLVFFCASSIQSAHLCADLRTLQAKFKQQITIIGVHTPKHSFEAEPVNIEQIVRRWQLTFPVINDAKWILWRQFAMQAWPSTALFDASGKLSQIYIGDGHIHALERHLSEFVQQAALQQLQASSPAPQLNAAVVNSKLSFPSKLVALGERLYISDTAHHRVVECSFQGRITRTFGSGNPSFFDGQVAEAGMRAPGGICIGKDQLFICDTGNHAVRRVRLLESDQLDTIAGTGKVGYSAPEEGAPRSLSLASPSDCVFHNDKLYVTLAGQHQLWAFDLMRNTAQRVAGSGVEGLHDGSLMAAQFASPSAITFGHVGGRDLLFVLDAASASLRQIKVADFSVSTLIGEGLFDAGDSDGPASFARMAHPCGMHFDNSRGVLWIADSYNNKIKVYSPAKNEIKTLNVNYKLHHPSGLTIADGALWIANEFAHEILRLDLKTGRLAKIAIE
jgi:hypothetical protein